MFTRKTFLALAAVASVGALSLATDHASARGFAGSGMKMGSGHGGGIHHGGGGLRRTGGPGIRVIGGGGPRRIGRPGFVVTHRHRPHIHWGWRRHYWVAPVVATGVATGVVATGPTWNRCTCLTKEYTPDGAVVFKDLCTKEMAMNPSAVVQPTAYEAAQDTIVQGSLPPQVQAPQAVLPQVR